MNIIQAIRHIVRTLPKLQIVAGQGIHVEHTYRGAVISLEQMPEVSGAHAHTGMFQLVLDESDIPSLRIVDGNRPDLPHCGIAHVNGQPFPVPAFAEAAPTSDTYYYLRFTPPQPSEAPAEPDAAAQCAIVTATEPQDTTPDAVHYLLGRVLVKHAEAEGKGTPPAEIIRTLCQDHLPGNLYMDWYCPGHHLLDPLPAPVPEEPHP